MSQRSELQRIEAFSDAVFAIACTLLVIEIAVPHIEDVRRPGALWPALRSVLPSFVAYLISFTSLLVAWANHHRGLKILVRSSGALLYANGFLLLTVTFMPFPTAVLAEYINTPQANIAAVFYSAACLGMNLGFNICWLCVRRPVRLLAPSVSKAAERKERPVTALAQRRAARWRADGAPPAASRLNRNRSAVSIVRPSAAKATVLAVVEASVAMRICQRAAAAAPVAR